MHVVPNSSEADWPSSPPWPSWPRGEVPVLLSWTYRIRKRTSKRLSRPLMGRNDRCRLCWARPPPCSPAFMGAALPWRLLHVACNDMQAVNIATLHGNGVSGLCSRDVISRQTNASVAFMHQLGMATWHHVHFEVLHHPTDMASTEC